MRTIQVLEQATIDKIAAGEVVERPSSVVKELLENAIDAQATAVTVEIRDGGASLIRITDNGAGIPKDQIRLAFTRHATSKIRKVEDLTEIVSLGFRGEALSSIAAVSRVELITRTPEALTGVRYCIEGGIETEFEEIGAPSGTTFLVRNLFYNTPARAKFLKSPGAEGNRVAAIVEELALSHPDISFKFLNNGQNRLFTTGNGNLKEIVYQIYGRDMAKKLIPVEDKSDILQIRGFLGNPEIARGNRNFENYFINGRYVKSQLVAKAIEDGYHGFMMQHKYPFTLLYLTIRSDLVDVNVHPSKMEVRIQEQEQVYRQITLAVQNALISRERIPEITFDSGKGKKPDTSAGKLSPAPEPFEKNRRGTANPTELLKMNQNGRSMPYEQTGASLKTSDQIRETGVYRTSKPSERSAQRSPEPSAQRSPEPSAQRSPESSAQSSSERFAQRPSEPSVKKPAAPVQQELFPEKMLEKAARPLHRLIGQVFGTYWLIEFQDALYIIDQHAAHEKVLYERLMKAHREKQIRSQMIYPAVVVTLTSAEAELLTKHMEVFRALGYETEPFGGNDFRVTAVPDNLYRTDPDRLFTEILDELSEYSEQEPEQILDRLASMSCKAAVKGNHTMSVREAEALIDELLTLENPYNCPHGRPTIVSMSHYELDKKFKRII